MSETSPQAGANDMKVARTKGEGKGENLEVSSAPHFFTLHHSLLLIHAPGEPSRARSDARFVGEKDEPPPGIPFGHAWNE